MTITDIGKLFTERVNEYLNKGYYYCIQTMNGCQGEDAKVDLTNGKDFVRVYVDSGLDVDLRHHKMEVVVGKYSGKIDYNRLRRTVWMDSLKIISEDVFYAMNIEETFFGTKEQAEEAKTKRHNRRAVQWKIQRSKIIDFDSDEVKKMLLPLVRYKVKGCKTAKASEISVLKLDPATNKNPYRVYCRGHEYCLR